MPPSIVTWPKDTARNRTRGIPTFVRQPRSCYLQYNGIEAFFEVRKFVDAAGQWVDSMKQLDRNDLSVGDTIPINIRENTLIMRQAGKSGQRPDSTIFLHIVQQSEMRRSLKRIRTNTKDGVLGKLTDDLVVRALGFTERIRNYEYFFQGEDDTQVATVNIYYLLLMVILLAFIIVLFFFSLSSTPSFSPLPLTYDEAFDEVHNLFVKNRCERRRHSKASFRLVSQSGEGGRI